MKRFASDRVAGLMERLGLEDDVAIESGLVGKTIESAQSRVEGFNFDMRKRVVEFDDVINRQRETIYDERNKVLRNEDLSETVRIGLDSPVRQGAELDAVTKPGVFDQPAQQRPRVDRAARERLRFVKPGKCQQVIYQARHARDLELERALDPANVLGARVRLAGQHLDLTANRGQRGAQLVRRIRDELLLA